MNTLSIKGEIYKIPMRVITLITMFLATVSLVQSGMILTNEAKLGQVSMPVVVIFLLVTPLIFAGTIFMAVSIHGMAQEKKKGAQLIIAYALFLLAAVDNMIYIPIHYEKDAATSFLILGGIELICLGICFFYFQNMGPKALALCGSILLILSFGLEFIEAVRYVSSFRSVDVYVMYNFVKKLVNFLIAVSSILYVLGLRNDVVVKEQGDE